MDPQNCLSSQKYTPWQCIFKVQFFRCPTYNAQLLILICNLGLIGLINEAWLFPCFGRLPHLALCPHPDLHKSRFSTTLEHLSAPSWTLILYQYIISLAIWYSSSEDLSYCLQEGSGSLWIWTMGILRADWGVIKTKYTQHMPARWERTGRGGGMYEITPHKPCPCDNCFKPGGL